MRQLETIQVFGDKARQISDGDIFFAKKSSVEGRDVVHLKTPLHDERPSDELESDIRFILKNHYEEMPHELLQSIHGLVEMWLVNKRIDEGLDAFDRRDK